MVYARAPQFPAVTLPDGKPLPIAYRWLHALGVVSLPPWHFVEGQERAMGMREEFLRETAAPNQSRLRDWMPFAARQDCDDVVGFVLVDGAAPGAVCVVHLTWAGRPERPGFPGVDEYDDFWDWLQRDAIPETRDWADEEWIADLVAGDDPGADQ
jgi:hypothetical protein